MSPVRARSRSSPYASASAQLRPGAGVLPDHGVRDRTAGGPVPDHGGLPLVGDADRRQPFRAGAGGVQRLPHHELDVVPDLLGVVLDPTGPGEDLPVLALGHGDDLPGPVEHDAPRGGGALVDGGDVLSGHGSTVPGRPRVRRPPTAVRLVNVRDIAVFSGTAHPDLAAEICAHLGVPLHRAGVPVRQRLPGGAVAGELPGADVFLIQPLVPPVQENLVELLLMIDAARGASAGRITVVLPHYAYARSDKKDAPRISIGGRLVADLLTSAGANRVLAMTLHSPQVHGFFSVPVDHLHALRELAGHFQRYDLSNTVVVSPDLGNAKEAAAFARMLGTPVAAGAKQRFSDDLVKISTVIGEVADRDVIVLDDEIAKGSTVIELMAHLRELKVRSIRLACTHGLFSSGALDRLSGQDGVLEIVCTNTVPIPAEKRVPKLEVLSVAPALAEAMRRIHNGESVSALFG